MTIAINHAFVSLKGDGTDSTQVQPSNWNAGHSITLATGQLIGRLSPGAGAAEEIPISAYMANLLQAADANTLAGLIGLFTTGDVKWGFQNTAPGGWVLITGVTGQTIGNASSGAALRANADTVNLFTLLWNNCSNSVAPVSGGRGANAAADYAANKTITIPQLSSVSPIGAGPGGSGYTARVLGTVYGAESISLGTANMASFTPSGSVTSTVNGPQPGNQYILSGTGNNVGVGGTYSGGGLLALTTVTVSSSFSGNNNGGSSQPFGLLQPSVALNPMVKL